MSTSVRFGLGVLGLLGLTTVFAVSPADAGCGCDHPPPIRGYVYPSFAWVGGQIDVDGSAVTTEAPCVRVGGEDVAEGWRGRRGSGGADKGLCAGGTKAQVLTLQYTGAGCEASRHAQARVTCKGSAPTVSPVRIVATEGKRKTGTVWVDREVRPGDTVKLDAKVADMRRLSGSDTFVLVSDPTSGKVLQEITFRTNCSQVLREGDQFGSLRLVGFVAEPEGGYEVRTDLPLTAALGPQSVEIFDAPCSALSGGTRPAQVIPASEFTVIGRPLPLLEVEGRVLYSSVLATVDTDGNLLIPFDLSRVTRAMQFYAVLIGLPLRFEAEDIGFYNKEQYDLKLFTTVANGPEDHQWGPFYGAQVDKIRTAWASHASDAIGYWRHGFESYRQAHLPGSTHELGIDGRHPDGTLHVDHDYLVASIKGWRSNTNAPFDRSLGQSLSPGTVRISIEVSQLFADAPVRLSDLPRERKRMLDTNYHEVKVDRLYQSLLEARFSTTPKYYSVTDLYPEPTPPPAP